MKFSKKAYKCIKELRKALREAYTQPGKVLEKGIKALETAKKHSWDATAKKICDLK